MQNDRALIFMGKTSILNLISGSRNSLVRKHFLKMNFSQRAIQEFLKVLASPGPSVCYSVVCDLTQVADELSQIINISFLYL